MQNVEIAFQLELSPANKNKFYYEINHQNTAVHQSAGRGSLPT